MRHQLFAMLLASGQTVFRLGEADGTGPVPNEGETVERTLELARTLAAFECIDWETETIVEDLAGFELLLCRQVDDQRDLLIAGERELNENRRYEYQSKLREAYNDAGQWPWLTIEAAHRGIAVEDMRLLVMMASEASERFMATEIGRAHV